MRRLASESGGAGSAGDSIAFRYESAFQQQPLRPPNWPPSPAPRTVLGATGRRGDTSAAATFSSRRTLILCVVSLRVRASDSFCIAGELEA